MSSAVEALLAEVQQHAGGEPLLTIVLRGVTDSALLLGEEIVKAKRVRPVEGAELALT